MECKCKNCTERHLGCHDKCEDYKKFRKECDKRIENRNKQRKLNDYFLPRIQIEQAYSRGVHSKFKTVGEGN